MSVPDVVAHESGGALVRGVQDARLVEHIREQGFRCVKQTPEGILAYPAAMLTLEDVVREWYTAQNKEAAR